jgi:hypothetical protein
MADEDEVAVKYAIDFIRGEIHETTNIDRRAPVELPIGCRLRDDVRATIQLQTEFLRLTMAGGAEPILYLNPYQRWKLPEALASHETRVWTSRIERTPATRQPTLNTIGFVDTSGYNGD